MAYRWIFDDLVAAYRRRRLIDGFWVVADVLPSDALPTTCRQGRIRIAIKARTARREYEAVVKDMENQRLVGGVSPAKEYESRSTTVGLLSRV